MPFIVQCPHEGCRKYMLLEDTMRGSTVECLLCKRSIRVDGSASGNPTAAASSGAAAPAAQQQKVVNCPKCQTPLRLSTPLQGQAIRCPKCSHVFKV